MQLYAETLIEYQKGLLWFNDPDTKQSMLGLGLELVKVSESALLFTVKPIVEEFDTTEDFYEYVKNLKV